MTPPDVDKLRDKLTGLVEAMPLARPLTDEGLIIWARALKQYGINDILESLDTWGCTRTKMPSPAEIREICERVVARRVEEKARKESVTSPTTTPVGSRLSLEHREALMQIAALDFSPSRASGEWAYRLIERAERGEGISPGVLRMAREAVERLGPRVPPATAEVLFNEQL